VGWNVVTTGNPAAAANFGDEPHLPKAERYKKAREFTDVVRGLWDSWDDDAFIRDRETGIFFDQSKMHVLDHNGAYYNVRGPLNVARSPQGQPVIVQAGDSDAGREMAAETAEVMFTAHEELAPAQAFYADVKNRMAKFGRHPGDLKIMPGLSVVVAKTRQEAQDKFQQLQNLIHPEIGIAGCSKVYMQFEEDPEALWVAGPYHDRHALHCTMAFRKGYFATHSYDNEEVCAVERQVTNNFTEPMIQLNPRRTILHKIHSSNTYKEKRSVGLLRKTDRSVATFIGRVE
jgi:FMN-dependent oxidoreductase (nitrilotriacetate monooxygenase family)